MIDANRMLAPFVEGMLMGAVDYPRIDLMLGEIGWSRETAEDPQGRVAMYFISPSGIRWRIRAEIEDE